MFVSLSDMQNSFEKYLELAADQDIIITQDGQPIAKLVAIHYLSDHLVGIIPQAVEYSVRNERLERQ